MSLCRLRVVPLLLVLAVIVSPLAQAQQPETDAQPDSARAAVANTPVVDSLQIALDRFEVANPPTATDSTRLRRWADSLQKKGNAIRRQNPLKARGYLWHALQSRRILGDSTRVAARIEDVGVTYFNQSRYEPALDHLERALALHRAVGNQVGAASALSNVGVVHYFQGRYDQALAKYRAALEAYRSVDDRQSEIVTLNNIGLTHRIQGRYEEALKIFRKTLSGYREVGDRNGVASALVSIGLVYADQGRYNQTLSRYREALQIRRETGDRKGEANILTNIGSVYKILGRYDQALDSLKKGRSILRDVGDRRFAANTSSVIGTLYKNQGRYEKALDLHRDELETHREIGNKNGVANALKSIGTVYHERGDYATALDHFRKALPIYRDNGNRRGISGALSLIGKGHLERGHFQGAIDTLNRSIRLAERLRLNATSPEARRSLLARQIGTYQALITAHTRSEQPDSALRATEQARARLLADRLAGTARDTSFTIPSVANLRRTLGPDEAALLYANAGTEWPLTAVVITRDRVVARELPDSTVRAGVQEAYASRLRRLRREEGPLTAALGSGRSGQGELPSLAEAIRLYRYYLTRGQTGTSIQNDLSQRLHGLLVEPIADAVADERELTVVPTGALGYLPFETLQDSTGQYLVEDKHVRYAQSLTVLRQLRQRTYDDRERPLLALGGAAYRQNSVTKSESVIAEARRGSTQVATRGHAATLFRDAERRMEQGKSPRSTYQQLGYRTWANLPGTKTEVRRLGRLAGSGTTVVTGRDASEDTIRSMSERGQLGRYRRIHFATHGIAVPETPKLSALVLSQIEASDSLAARDGYLTMEEIAGLKMRADVAVLSACQTGLGKVVAGEGVVSLSHAFLRAGANATLVSQWKVLDKSTRQFMTAVYKRAKAEGTSFAEAVTETKRAFIAGEYGEKNTDPLRWAPFVYYGRD